MGKAGKRTISIISGIVFMTMVCLQACAIGEWETGSIREVSGFENVSFATAGELIITQGDRETLEIEALASDLSNIVTEVRDGTLSIGRQGAEPFSPFRAPVFRLTVKKIAVLETHSSGSITIGELSADSLRDPDQLVRKRFDRFSCRRIARGPDQLFWFGARGRRREPAEHPSHQLRELRWRSARKPERDCEGIEFGQCDPSCLGLPGSRRFKQRGCSLLRESSCAEPARNELRKSRTARRITSPGSCESHGGTDRRGFRLHIKRQPRCPKLPVQFCSPEQSRTGDREVNAIVRTSDRGHHQFFTHVLSEAKGGWTASVPSRQPTAFP